MIGSHVAGIVHCGFASATSLVAAAPRRPCPSRGSVLSQDSPIPIATSSPVRRFIASSPGMRSHAAASLYLESASPPEIVAAAGVDLSRVSVGGGRVAYCYRRFGHRRRRPVCSVGGGPARFRSLGRRNTRRHPLLRTSCGGAAPALGK